MKTRLNPHPSGTALRKRRDGPVRCTHPARLSAASAPCGFTRILVPVDFSVGSERALRHAAALAHRHHGRVLPLHVTPPICFTTDCGYGPVHRTEPDEDSLRQTRTRLQKLVRRSVPAELAERVTVCSGDPIEQIIKAATERKADLIVMLAHDAPGGKPPPPTHTVDRLVRETRCPVLVVHLCEPSRKRAFSNREKTP